MLDEGAANVIACATHGLFSGPAYERLAYENSGIERIVVTDTVPLAPGAPENITVLPASKILADSIRRIFADDSVSEIFAGENQLVLARPALPCGFRPEAGTTVTNELYRGPPAQWKPIPWPRERERPCWY